MKFFDKLLNDHTHHDHHHSSSPPPSSALENVKNIPLPTPLPQPANLASAPPLPTHIPPTDPLQMGIWYISNNITENSYIPKLIVKNYSNRYHEQNCLDISAYYFSHSAALGNSIGLLLYGISMRHGWGMQKDQTESLKILQKAAQMAGSELQLFQQKKAGKHKLQKEDSFLYPSHVGLNGEFGEMLGLSGTLKKIQTNELGLALSEISMSFRMGWGVQKDLTAAVHYLEMAANLGDADAQFDLAEMYMRGDGVKKNKHKAAHWYRLAEKGGKHGVQMQWIWKKKYDDPDGEGSSESLADDED
ncbi:hypothetical protein HK098_001343 [Nowakowskiella sp. JEL0407]|nr:hypothetical protein HK098_001343 [Nowakowskiella sp. JEL0407]